MARALNRRALIRSIAYGSGGLVLGPMLAACAQASPTPTAAPKAAATTAPEPTKPAAATKPAATAAATAKPAQSQPVTLRLHSRSGSESKFFEDRLAAFTKVSPAITVKQEPIASAEYWTKILTMHAGATLGDVIWSDNSKGEHLFCAASGALQPLEQFVSADKFDLSQYYKAAVELGKHEGKMFGLPFKLPLNHNAVYYNEKIFKEAGVPLPKWTGDWTVSQLVDVAVKLSKDTTGKGKIDQFGLEPIRNHNSGYRSWAIAFGGEYMDAEGRKSLIHTPEFISGMQLLYDLIYKHKVSTKPSDLTSGGVGEMFIAGKVGMMQNGSWQKSIGLQIKDKFQWSAALMPKGPSGIRMGEMNCNHMAMTSHCKAGPQAWDTMKWLCNKESGIALGVGVAGQSSTCGARPDVFNSPELINNPTYKPEVHQIYILSVEEADKGVLPTIRMPWNFRGQELLQAMNNEMDPVWLDKQKPTKEFFEGMSKRMQMILDKPRP